MQVPVYQTIDVLNNSGLPPRPGSSLRERESIDGPIFNNYVISSLNEI